MVQQLSRVACSPLLGRSVSKTCLAPAQRLVLLASCLAVFIPTSVSAISVTLGWNANTETNLAGYRIYYGSSSRNYANSLAVGKVTTYKLTGLSNGVPHYFAVTALSTANLESDFSNEAVYQPGIPSISAIADVAIDEDTSTTLAFTISDIDTPVGNLQVSVASTNTVLIPNQSANLLLGGTGTNRTLLLRPVANGFGTSLVTVTVSDGVLITTESFLLTVRAVNDAPEISLPSLLTGLKQSSISFTGLAADIDAGATEVTVNLRARYGTIRLLTDVPSGLQPAQVQGNGTTNVTVTALRGRINTTWRYPGGFTYTGMRNFVGPDTLTATMSDNGNTGLGGALTDSKSTSVSITGNKKDYWRKQYFATETLLDPIQEQTSWGDQADPEGDATSNLFEYALGLNPLISEPLDNVLYPGLLDLSGSRYVTLTFPRRLGDPTLQYLPEVSSDQQTWSAGATQGFVVPLNADFERVTFRDVTPITATAPRFMRLRVVQPD
jgi:hypothetical protein